MKFLRSSVVFLIAILPLYIIRFNVAWVPTTLLEFVFGGVFLLWLNEVRIRGRIRPLAQNVPIKGLLLLFVCVGLFSFLFSYNVRSGIGLYKAYFLEPVLLFVIFVDLGKRKIIYVSDVVFGLAVSAFYLSGLAILQYYLQADWFAPHEISAGRVSGVFNSANALALYLEPIIFLLGVIVFKESKFSRRGMFFAVTLVLSVMAIALSRSTGSLVAFASLLGVTVFYRIYGKNSQYEVLSKLKNNLFPAFVVCLFTITLIMGAVSYKVVSEMPPVEYKGGNTFLIRMVVWTGTFNLLSEHPVFGAGLGGFKDLYTNQYLPVQYTESLQYPHNIFLNFWSETGIIGVLIFAAINHEVLKKTSKNKGAITFALYGIIFLIFMHGLVDVPYFKNDLSMEFWALVSLAFFE